MRLVAVVSVVVLAVVACARAPEGPTPLPTAVPPDQGATGNWAIGFRHEFPTGSFGEGRHRFRLLVHCLVLVAQDINSDWQFFEISDQAPLQPGPVYLRLAGLSSDPLASQALASGTLHPNQKVVAVMHWVGIPRASADLVASQCETLIFWDNTGRQSLAVGEPFQR